MNRKVLVLFWTGFVAVCFSWKSWQTVYWNWMNIWISFELWYEDWRGQDPGKPEVFRAFFSQLHKLRIFNCDDLLCISLDCSLLRLYWRSAIRWVCSHIYICNSLTNVPKFYYSSQVLFFWSLRSIKKINYMRLLHHSQSSSIDNKKTYFTSVLSYAR